MKALMLKDIIENLSADCGYCGNMQVTGVSTDTRTIKKGDIFIALAGENFDGHAYVGTAVENGACAVICSKPVETEVPVLLVKDTLAALQRLAEYYLSTLDIKVVAITGSNGKTTTRDMTASVLSSKYRVYSTAKNFNNEIGLPKSVLELDDSYDIAVLEMGMNHFGEISRLTNIAKPDVAAITNIGKAHIGNLGSQENILKAKLEILEGLKADGLLVVNGDDAFLSGADTKAFEKNTVSIKNDCATLFAKNIKTDGGDTRFTVVNNGKETEGSIPVLGNYNVLNSLEAMCIGLHFGVDIASAFKALGGYTSVGMRCESEDVNGVTLVKDYYNASPDSSRVALETLGSYARGGRKFAVLGEMLELGDYSAREHCTLGEMCVDNGIDFAFFIGDDFVQFKKGMPENSDVFPKEKREALEEALERFVSDGRIKKGDVVLIKGSRGMKMEQFYELLKKAL